MDGLLDKISSLGLKANADYHTRRNITITNQLNFFFIFFLIILIITTSVIRWVSEGEYTIHTQKLLILLLLLIPNFYFSYKGWHKLTRINMIFSSPLILIFLPVFMGEVQQVDFIHAPLILIGLSFIPQLALKPTFKNTLYSISLLYYLIQAFFLDTILVAFAQVELTFILATYNFHVYYKVVIIATLVFLHITLHYLRNLNLKYEKKLETTNNDLYETLNELKLTQQQLIQSEKLASVGTLTAGVAHEINNPLNYINGGIYLVEELVEQIRATDEERNKLDSAIYIVKEGVEKASKIVTSLSSFSQRGISKMQETRIDTLIDNTLLFLGPKIPEDVRIIKDYKFSNDVLVYSDKIHQSVLNILDNALFAVNLNGNNEKKIRISTEEKEGYVVISIFNNGPEIPESDLGQLFDPFFTTKDPGQGVGLGLSIAYTYIADHKGKIHVKNMEEGVCFEVLIPEGREGTRPVKAD